MRFGTPALVDPKRSHNIDYQFSSFRTLGDLSGVVEIGRQRPVRTSGDGALGALLDG